MSDDISKITYMLETSRVSDKVNEYEQGQGQVYEGQGQDPDMEFDDITDLMKCTIIRNRTSIEEYYYLVETGKTLEHLINLYRSHNEDNPYQDIRYLTTLYDLMLLYEIFHNNVTNKNIILSDKINKWIFNYKNENYTEFYYDLILLAYDILVNLYFYIESKDPDNFINVQIKHYNIFSQIT
jgi:hypothetical protein